MVAKGRQGENNMMWSVWVHPQRGGIICCMFVLFYFSFSADKVKRLMFGLLNSFVF